MQSYAKVMIRIAPAVHVYLDYSHTMTCTACRTKINVLIMNKLSSSHAPLLFFNWGEPERAPYGIEKRPPRTIYLSIYLSIYLCTYVSMYAYVFP